jgi:hypothetical protein
MDTSNSNKDVLLPEWYDVNPDIEKDLERLLSATRNLRANVPRGYSDGGDGLAYPITEDLLALVRMTAEVRYKSQRSMREGLALVNSQLSAPINSIGGFSTVMTRIEKDLNIYKGEASSTERLQAERKKQVQERRTAGLKRKKIATTPDQERIDRQKVLTAARNDLKELKAKEKRLKASMARKAMKLKLSGDPTKEVQPEKKPKVPRTEYDEAGLPQEREVAFRPNPGPQTEFLSSDEDIVLYGGQAGGGKSMAMVVDPLRYAHCKNHRAVIIRKTMPELKELLDSARELYFKYDPKVRFRENPQPTFKFSSGAEIMFRFLDRREDMFKFQGIAYTYIGFDELSQQATPEGFNYVRSRLRSAKSGEDEIRCYVRATANPGSLWVYEMFIKDREPNKAFIMPGTEKSQHPTTLKFIPAKLSDNPYLDEDGRYRSVLESLGETLKKQLLEGDWLASNDNMFNEFEIPLHVVDPFTIPKHWTRVAGLDYGYKDPSAGVWFAVDPEDGSLVVYDEFMEVGLTGREFALAIKEKEENELVTVDHPIDWQIYAKTGHTGPSIAESMFTVRGFQCRKADKNRDAGWVQIHELLRRDPVTGIPKVRIFSSCKNLIKQLMSVKVHPTKPGDINQNRNSDGHWDLLDAFRYGVMSRPKQETYEDRLMRSKSGNTWNKYRGYFN